MYGLELRLSLKRLKGHLQPAQDVGLRLKEYPNRQVECLNCRYREDRDITACLNMLKASEVRVRFALELLKYSREPNSNKILKSVEEKLGK